MAKSGYRRRLTAVGALALVSLAAVGVTVVRADDTPALPTVAAQELLASTLQATADPELTISGSVTTSLDLGLPELPASLGGGPAGAVGSILGEQHWKVWRSPDGLRVAHLLDLREQDLVVDQREAWWWDSLDMTATRLPFPPRASVEPAAGPDLERSGSPGDPTALARTLIEGVRPCASVSVQGTATVAGRDAYLLALTPLAADSLLGSVDVAIDAASRLPLRVEVRPRGSDEPAIAGGYTSVSLDPIDPGMFRFEPPAGATVRDASDLAEEEAAASDASDAGTPPRVTDVRTFGDCLGVVLEVRMDGSLPPEVASFLPYAGPLSSVVAVDRGDHTWILAGLVGARALEDRAADLP